MLQKILLIPVISILVLLIVPMFYFQAAASSEFDRSAYTWTDKIIIRIVAPDFNFDSHSIDEIGNDSFNPVKISTRGHTLDQYKLVETGPNTGIFVGEVILTGFCHNADGNPNTGTQSGNSECNRGDDTNPRNGPLQNGGPTNGFLMADNNDGITISFEYTEDHTVLSSAPIRWNMGEVHWLESNYSATGTGIVRVIDPDMNLNPEAIDNFNIDVWSDSDAGGINLTVTETGEMTGVFEGTVFFTTTNESSGSRLLVAQGDTVIAEYEDNTLPNPYTIADELDIAGTTLIGTVVPPLERTSISGCKLVDSFGNTITKISSDQQIQVTCNLTNNQDTEQPFAYLVQIKNSDEITVHLAWITGALLPGQTLESSLSWSTTISGLYNAEMFVWESIEDPIPLSNTVSLIMPVT